MEIKSDRLDRAAGRTINVLYGLQLLGAAVSALVVAVFVWFMGIKILSLAVLAVGATLGVMGVRSLFLRERLSEMDPESGIEFG